MPLTNTKFSITPEGIDKYQLTIQFLEDGNISSEKIFTFNKNFLPIEGKPLLDIYSINGLYNSKILKSLFKKTDIKAISSAIKKLDEMDIQGRTLVVLDIKGQEGYEKHAIEKVEKTVCEFFKKEIGNSNVSENAEIVHNLFCKQKPVDFVLCEGSLKKRLLKEFTTEEVDFLQSPSGSKDFCQIAEFFMNGFKFGHETADIHAEDYIFSCTGKTFTPSNEKNIILYPGLYQDIYSISGSFTKAISPIFHVTGAFDPSTKITTVNLEAKK